VTDACPDCGEEYDRVNQHLAMTDCGSDGSKTILICQECEEQFKEYTYRVNSDRDRDGTKYCSVECKHEASRQGECVDCDWCEQSTYKSPSYLKNNDHHFCSEECENNWRSDYMSGAESPNYLDRDREVVCEECGEAYEVKPSVAEQTRFCSKECHNKSQRNEPITRACDNCGDDVTRKPQDFKGEKAFCSTDCWTEHLSEARRGKKNPAWKGGKSIVDRIRSELGDKSWNRIAEEQRKAAGRECEDCGAKPENRLLSVHHIIPVASGGTHGDWNLMVLCNDCHRKIENITRQFTSPHIFAPVADD
jgi:hypothetical protein